MDKTPNHKWMKLKQVLPPTHPFIRIKESAPMSVDKTQWLTKLSKMIPTHHSINQILERNVDKN